MGPAGRLEPIAGRVGGSGVGGVVSRSGLFERLGAAARVTVVSAPPGSGKTILLRSWIGAAGLAARAAWVSVGHDERDPQRFWGVAARCAAPDFCGVGAGAGGDGGTAHGMLQAMGMEGFAARARRELRATGETARRRAVAVRDGELTAQEAQIARLARDGLSNPEIATRLFLSPRTVLYHLAKVFTKLDITSRRQLRRILPATADTARPR
jgi:ATP/maltotriose-dependent transcriptional regulator MalT